MIYTRYAIPQNSQTILRNRYLYFEMCKFKNTKIISCLILFLGLSSFLKLTAQLSVVYPAERSVFQRDNSNRGTISISGNLVNNADKVEARLIPVVFGQGTGTDWITIDSQIEGFSFTGKIESTGGWYTLEIRSFKGIQVVDIGTVQKVGIGEVFVIAGQSNAQGFGNNINAVGASDDRVNGYNYYNNQFLNESVPMDKFTKIQANDFIGPRGLTAWCWGELGDKLVKRLNVPVMFYNAATEGSSLENWVSSAAGRPTVHPYTGQQFQGGTPYSNLRIVLQNLSSLYGVRAVLWHQGEADSFTSESSYFDGLKTLIAETRKNTGKNINWVVAKASLNANQVFAHIIKAQNAVINTTQLVFDGPATDGIQFPRPDGVHFSNSGSVNGLSILADSWDQSLNTFFFTNSTPFKGTELNEIKFKCDVNNLAVLRLDKSFASIRWDGNNGSTSASTIQVNQGDYSAVARDAAGNYIFSNVMKVRDAYPRFSPTITPAISITACIGKTVELKANTVADLSLVWNTGETSTSINSGESKAFYANFKNTFDCLSPNSNQLTPQFVNPPPKPNLEFVNNKNADCEGGKVEVRVNNPFNFGVQWNTGETTNTVAYTSTPPAGSFVTLYSNFDCPSPVSNTVKPLIQILPATPTLVQSGPYSMEAISNDDPNQFEWYLENKFLKVEQKDLMVTQNGYYKVNSVKNFTTPTGGTLTCKSKFSSIVSYTKNSAISGLSVYPNPVVDGTFKLTSDTEIKNVNIQLYTSDGQLVLTSSVGTLLAPVPIHLNEHRTGGKFILSVGYGNTKKTYNLIFE